MTTTPPPLAPPLLLLLPLTLRAEDPLVTNPPPAVDPAFLDANTKPGDDFFAYANGGWIKHAAIPGDRSSYGITQEMDESNENILHKILEDCAAQDRQRSGRPRHPAPESRRPLPQRHGHRRRQRRRDSNPSPRGSTPSKNSPTAPNSPRCSPPCTRAVGRQLSRSPAAQDERNSTAQIALVYQGGLGFTQ